MELPQYTFKPSINRMVVPWVFKLLGLSAAFYFGIYFNVKFMFKLEVPVIINVLIFLVLVVMIVMQLVLYHVRFSKYNYKFYSNRLDYEAKTNSSFLFSEFTKAELRQNLFDKMFNTGQIVLSKDFVIGPISNVTQIKNYLERLIQYYQYSQQQFKIKAARQATGLGQQVKPVQASKPQIQTNQTNTNRTMQTGVSAGRVL